MGETNTPEVDIAKVLNIISKFYDKLGLTEKTVDSNVANILKLNIEQMRQLSPLECAENAVLLSREALFIQQEINKMYSQITWGMQVINLTISNQLGNYGQYTPYPTRKLLAIKDNEYTLALYKILCKLKIRIKSISYIPKQLTNLSYTYQQLAITKGTLK